MQALRSIGKAILLLGFAFATHCTSWSVRAIVGVSAGAGLGLMGYRKGSLSDSGAAVPGSRLTVSFVKACPGTTVQTWLDSGALSTKKS